MWRLVARTERVETPCHWAKLSNSNDSNAKETRTFVAFPYCRYLVSQTPTHQPSSFDVPRYSQLCGAFTLFFQIKRTSVTSELPKSNSGLNLRSAECHAIHDQPCKSHRHHPHNPRPPLIHPMGAAVKQQCVSHQASFMNKHWNRLTPLTSGPDSGPKLLEYLSHTDSETSWNLMSEFQNWPAAASSSAVAVIDAYSHKCV